LNRFAESHVVREARAQAPLLEEREPGVAAELVGPELASERCRCAQLDHPRLVAKSAADLHRNLQFTAYSILRNAVDATPDRPREVRVVEITKTKVPAVHIQPTPRDAADYATYRKILGKVAEAIRAGYDPPAPSSFCGSCSYRRSRCPIQR
jgi:hypothetical protein